MPMEGFHSARQMPPDACDSIRQKEITDGVAANICIVKGKASKIQSVHFDAKKFTPEEAKAWLEKHSFSTKEFVPAKSGKTEASASAVMMKDVSQCPKGSECPMAQEGDSYGEMSRCGTPGIHAVNLAAEGLPTELRLTSADLEIQAEAKTDGMTRRAFAATSYTGVSMKLPGFSHPVVVDLSGMKVPAQRMPVLRQHDPERPIGHTTMTETSAQRLRNAGFLHDVTGAGKETLALVAAEFPFQVSLGADVQQMEFVDKGATAKVNGRNFDGPVYVAKGTTLREISLVPMGADANTTVAVAGVGAPEVAADAAGFRAEAESLLA